MKTGAIPNLDCGKTLGDKPCLRAIQVAITLWLVRLSLTSFSSYPPARVLSDLSSFLRAFYPCTMPVCCISHTGSLFFVNKIFVSPFVPRSLIGLRRPGREGYKRGFLFLGVAALCSKRSARSSSIHRPHQERADLPRFPPSISVLRPAIDLVYAQDRLCALCVRPQYTSVITHVDTDSDKTTKASTASRTRYLQT